jgi:hypothetical protein
MDAAQQGRANRNAGRDFEVDVANFLSDRLELDVVTARFLARGTQAGADLVTVLERDDDGVIRSAEQTVHGWSVECKASKDTHKITPWMRQARRQADGSMLYCVVAKRRQKPTGQALVYVPRGGLMWWLTGQSFNDHEPRCMTLDTFVDVLGLPAWETADVA